MNSLSSPTLLAILTVAGIGLLAACGGDAAQSGETLIETELAEQLGIGDLTASCDQPADSEIGTEFRCTATTEDDRVVEFLGVFTSEDEIFVSPTNVLTQNEMVTLREQAAAVLSPEVGVDIDPAWIECPADDPLFLGGGVDEGIVECIINDPQTGSRYDLTVTLSDYVPQQGYQNLFAAIGDLIE